MATTTKDQTVTIRPLNLERITVRIEGMSPLITDRFSTASAEALAESQQGAGARQVKPKKAARDPQAEFVDRLYEIEPGVYGFPAGGIKKAIVNAGGRFTDAQMTWLRGVFNIDSATGLIRIEGPEPTMRVDHVVQMGRGNVRYRPAFFPWAMELPISYNADEIGPSEIIHLLQQAGFSIGIGNWRPEKNGSFGTFRVAAP